MTLSMECSKLLSQYDSLSQLVVMPAVRACVESSLTKSIMAAWRGALTPWQCVAVFLWYSCGEAKMDVKPLSTQTDVGLSNLSSSLSFSLSLSSLYFIFLFTIPQLLCVKGHHPSLSNLSICSA